MLKYRLLQASLAVCRAKKFELASRFIVLSETLLLFRCRRRGYGARRFNPDHARAHDGSWDQSSQQAEPLRCAGESFFKFQDDAILHQTQVLQNLRNTPF